MDKQTIRKELLVKRNSLSSKEYLEKSSIIQEKVITSRLFSECNVILAYSDFKNEVATSLIIRQALVLNKKLYLPKVEEASHDFVMNFYEINNLNDLQSGYFGISEPNIIEPNRFSYNANTDYKVLMIVPGVGFDKNCNRLGFGKGFYDRFLFGKTNIITLGICYDFQIINSLPVTLNDVPLDYLFTESNTYTSKQ